MRALALAISLGALACTTSSAPTTKPETIRPSPSSRVDERSATAQPGISVGEFVVIRGDTRLHARPETDADWIQTYDRDAESTFPKHAYTLGRVLAKKDAFLEVELVGEYDQQYCIPPTPLTGLRVFVDEESLLSVATEDVTLEEDGAHSLTIPAGTPVIRTDSADELYTADNRVLLRERLAAVGRSYSAVEEPNCVDTQIYDLDVSDVQAPAFAGVERITPVRGGLAGRIGYGWSAAHVYTRSGLALGKMRLMRLEHTHGEADPNHPERRCFPVTDVWDIPAGSDICATTNEMAPDLAALPKSKIGLKSVEFEGPGDEEKLRQELEQKRHIVASCYGRLMLRDPGARGEVTVHLDIGRKAAMHSLSGSAEATHPVVQRCVQTQYPHFAPWRPSISELIVTYTYEPGEA